MSLKFAFVGAVLSSYHALDELYRQGLKPELICTLPSNLAKRHSDYFDLRALASENATPVLEVDNINEAEVISCLQQIRPDYVLVIGWSQLIKQQLLHLPRHGCIGFHPSLLPKFRGRAILPWTILSGEAESGVSLFYLNEGTDSGDIITQRRYSIAPDETAHTLYTKAVTALREIIGDIAPKMLSNQPLPSIPQDQSLATYFAKRTSSDGWIDWSQSADLIARLIRAVGKPYPGAFTVYRDNKVIIWNAKLRRSYNYFGLPGQILAQENDAVVVQCGSGWLEIALIEDHTGREMAASEFFTRMHDRLGIDSYSLWLKLQG